MNFIKRIFSKKEETEAFADYYSDKDDIRADIDTALAVYNFLEEIDGEGAEVLRWQMKRKVQKAKRGCLEIICKLIEDIKPQQEETEDEEE